MVEISVREETLHLEVEGLDRLWALKSQLEVPLSNIRDVRFDPQIAHGWWKGFRMPGTHLPGVIIAGTFYHHGKRIFWDVHHPDKTIVIELIDDRFDELIVEVADPMAEVAKIQDAKAHEG